MLPKDLDSDLNPDALRDSSRISFLMSSRLCCLEMDTDMILLYPSISASKALVAFVRSSSMPKRVFSFSSLEVISFSRRVFNASISAVSLSTSLSMAERRVSSI